MCVWWFDKSVLVLQTVQQEVQKILEFESHLANNTITQQTSHLLHQLTSLDPQYVNTAHTQYIWWQLLYKCLHGVCPVWVGECVCVCTLSTPLPRWPVILCMCVWASVCVCVCVFVCRSVFVWGIECCKGGGGGGGGGGAFVFLVEWMWTLSWFTGCLECFWMMVSISPGPQKMWVQRKKLCVFLSLLFIFFWCYLYSVQTVTCRKGNRSCDSGAACSRHRICWTSLWCVTYDNNDLC